MQFDPENTVIKLCGKGMLLEGEGKNDEAALLFHQAWKTASTDFEKFTAAHYVARHQKSITDKLKWDQVALGFALKITEEFIKGTYPSLYLNIAKGYEDLGDLIKAKENYQFAALYLDQLPDDGYGNLIKGGVKRGLERTQK